MKIIVLILFVQSYAAAASDGDSLLCQILKSTEKTYAKERVAELFTEKFENSDGEVLKVEATAQEVSLTVGAGEASKRFKLAERMSKREFERLAKHIKENQTAYGSRMSYMKDTFRTHVNHVRIHEAFYHQPTPIVAARELVRLIERTTEAGGSRLKVDFISDGVPTTWEMIKSWSRLASTLHEVVERDLVGEVSKNLAAKREAVAESKRIEQGRQLLEEMLSKGEPIDQSELPTVDFEALLNKTVQDPSAVLIKISGFLDSVDYSRPLEIKIEKYGGGIQISMTGSRGHPKSLNDLVDRIQDWSKKNWRSNERLSSNKIPGNK